jgi:DNA invertase Pin-like site-specific DNA recombinase
MSTDNQQYSTQNQADAIRRYASTRNIEIVATYADEGKSGLNIERRDALQRLLADIQSGNANFQTVLVYDVSRWGRFQDADESAYYEYLCKRAGIAVQYCAEQFENDGSPISAIIKSLKRAMAGEYSRELSAKVFAGQVRIIELGFRLGGPAGFGLRRILLDAHGNVKGELASGQHKSITTDRVVLGLGPEDEVAIVREIFHRYVYERATTLEIASDLNARGIKTETGNEWKYWRIYQLLTNEKYMGNSVWNRYSLKLGTKRISNHPDAWIRVDDAFPAAVDRPVFMEAQRLLKRRANRATTCRLTDEQMLKELRELCMRRGPLSNRMIDAAKETPSGRWYRRRFGSLLNAYRLAGVPAEGDYRYIAVNNGLRDLYRGIIDSIMTRLLEAGCHVEFEHRSRLICVNEQLTLRVMIAQFRERFGEGFRWFLRFNALVQADITVIVRMDADNREPLDYYLLPSFDCGAPSLKLYESSSRLGAYRFASLDPLYEFLGPVRVTEAS